MASQYYFFSGKGGVGKTSMSAATALHHSSKGKRVLVISTDPAHSLSDSFEKPIGGELKSIGPNLDAVEIDPQKAMEEYKKRFSEKAQGMQGLAGLGLEDIFGMADMSPGIDEIAAFDQFMKYMQSEKYDMIIFDTAPTGHALRFLSLPDVLDSWVGGLIKMRLKLAGMMGMLKSLLPMAKDGQQFGTAELEAIKERIANARSILTDRKRTHFWLVTIPEAMSVYETERAAKTLEGYGIPIEGIIANQLVPETDSCAFCKARRRMQAGHMETIRKAFSGKQIKTVEMFDSEIKGPAMLGLLGKRIYN